PATFALPPAAAAPAATKLPAAEPAPESTSWLALALAGMVAVPVIGVTAGMLWRALAVRRLRRRRMALREQWIELVQSHPPRPAAPASAGTAAAARLLPRQPAPPLSP